MVPLSPVFRAAPSAVPDWVSDSRPVLVPAGAGRAVSGLNRPGWPNLAGRGMSFNICRGTLGSLAMFTAIRNASSRDSRFIDICRYGSSSK